jgi:amino acid transporter
MKTGKWVQNLGAIATWMPIVVLICAGSFVTWKFGFANPFSFKEFIPDFGNIKMIAFFSTLCFGFAGLELASVMGDEIKEPAKNLPAAIVISGIMIAFIYIVGTLSLLLLFPGKKKCYTDFSSNKISGIKNRISHHYEYYCNFNRSWRSGRYRGMALWLCKNSICSRY